MPLKKYLERKSGGDCLVMGEQYVCPVEDDEFCYTTGGELRSEGFVKSGRRLNYSVLGLRETVVGKVTFHNDDLGGEPCEIHAQKFALKAFPITHNRIAEVRKRLALDGKGIVSTQSVVSLADGADGRLYRGGTGVFAW